VISFLGSNISDIAKKIVPRPLRDVLRPYWNRVASSFDEKVRAREIAHVGPAQRWSSLQLSEINFWDDLLRNDEAQRLARMNPARPLQRYLTKLIDASPGSRVEILDVGAGPLTFVGGIWTDHEVHITAIDPNAVEYDQLLAKYQIEPPCRTKLGYMEDLSSVVPLSFFDLVHARNCVDHSKDPLRAIQEMVRAAKPGCCVFLNHCISEGRRNKYDGPHQWNLFPREGRFYIDRPGIKPIDVGEEINGSAALSVGPSLHGPEWFTVTIRRSA
jgi:SAM-dependent methyltransferase